MSEANLWQSIRKHCGSRGHFSRIEFNATEGYPDLSFCYRGVEGHIELKHTARAPARENTRVFGDAGLRPAQISWCHTRVKHGGNVLIVAQVGEIVFVIPGRHCRAFNEMTYFDLGRAALWYERPGWDRFLEALTRPSPRFSGGVSGR